MRAKHFSAMLLTFGMLTVLTGCGAKQDEPEPPATEVVTETEAAAETEAATEALSTEKKTEAPTEPPTKALPNVKVELTALRASLGEYDDEVEELDYKITNDTAKDIQAIKGVCHFKDVFDDEFLSIGATFSAVDKTENNVFQSHYYYNLNNEYVYDVNQFDSDDMKLYNSSLSEIHFEFELTGIAYADGSSESFD